MIIRHIKAAENWHYLAIGKWEPFKFLGCGSWICAEWRWFGIRVSYEIKRHFKLAIRRAA